MDFLPMDFLLHEQVANALNIVQSCVLPFAMLALLHVAADRQLLGSCASPRWLTLAGGLVATAVTGECFFF
jgi:Mn2+/Fe2+ NRAMP family transporter